MSRYRGGTLSYEGARALMETCRDWYLGKPLQNNTRLHKVGDSYAVRLHATDVVTIHPDGTYSLATNGWHTVTTASRIRGYSPASVGMVRGTYSVIVRGEWDNVRGEYIGRYAVPFYEGIRVDGEGRPLESVPGFNPSKIRKTKGWV